MTNLNPYTSIPIRRRPAPDVAVDAGRVIAVGLAAAALLGCSGKSAGRAAGSSSASPPYRTGCGIPPRVPGKLPAHWRTRSTAIGPIYLYSVREWAASPRADFAPLPGTHGKRFPGAKQLIVVRGGGVATLSIAPEDRAVASLMYDNIPFDHGYAVADGDPSVTFSDCATPATQWAGAFVVAGARCVRLLVNDATGRRVAARRIAFGVRGCASR
jgi:hypothetical protein